MISRAAAVAAREGMEKHRSTDSQLRVSLKPKPIVAKVLILTSNRQDGVLALDLEIAATTKLASASSLSANSQMLTGNGC